MKRAPGTSFLALLLLFAATSCDRREHHNPVPPTAPDAAATTPAAMQLATRHGCHVCHEMPGVDGGRIGPSLVGLGSRPTMAYAAVPPSVENVARYMQNPASMNPATRMPPMGLAPEEARAIAAWLVDADAAK